MIPPYKKIKRDDKECISTVPSLVLLNYFNGINPGVITPANR